MKFNVVLLHSKAVATSLYIQYIATQMLLHNNLFISENKVIYMQLCLLDKRTPDYDVAGHIRC